MADTQRADIPGASEYAADIAAARDRMLRFVKSCPAAGWSATVLDDAGDPRPVGVIVDHVAHAYEYLGGWISDLAAGGDPAVSAELVDALNAEHARAAARISPEAAAEHLRRSGDELVTLVGGLSPADLEAGGGRVRRLAQIAIWHADGHRSDIQAALAARADSAGS